MVKQPYPKRLIEVDLPIARISAHARREKSIRHGHISTLHIWWARRPLAACRAVICAALWPDPADPNCPRAFIEAAVAHITSFAKRVNPEKITEEKRRLQETVSEASRGRWEAIAAGTLTLDPAEEADRFMLRMCLLDFIADFANWDCSTLPAYLETSRALTQAAHEALGGAPSTRPLVVDPFAGGGSIPLEALRVGADAFASDLNPVPVLLNKVVLEYIPKYGQRLADEVRKWGEWIKREAEKELAEFYPKDPDGATPIAYLWARTVRCEGPACGAEVPLIRSLWLAKKANRSIALQLMPNPLNKRVDFQIIAKDRDGWFEQANPQTRIPDPTFDGTVKRGSATCPCCGYTTAVSSVRAQLAKRGGGTTDARALATVIMKQDGSSVSYRLPSVADWQAESHAIKILQSREAVGSDGLPLVPNEPLPPQGALGFRIQLYGMLKWGDLFTPRQLLTLSTFSRLIRSVAEHSTNLGEISGPLSTILATSIGKMADYLCSLCIWRTARSCVAHTFGRQALPITWDFGEMNPFAGSAGDWSEACRYLGLFIDHIAESNLHPGQSIQASATTSPLPNDAASAVVTDPPYYDAVGYSDLSDFFFVWLKRAVPNGSELMLRALLAPKDDECIVDPVRGKDRKYFERSMQAAMSESRRVLTPTGIAVVVFAHKSTTGWEAQLQALVDAGWIITGSWPIDTERPGRLRANDSAALASSVHLVCRPRENVDGSIMESVGEWRDVLGELPKRIHEWMPRLAAEGVVQTGQPLKIPAETFNAFLDAARDFRARQQSREAGSQPQFRQSGIVKVKNGSGEDRKRFEILGIDRPIVTPTDNLDTFQNRVLLVGVKPDGEDHPGRFCVLLEPLKADAIGLAVVIGVCPVRIDVQEESDTFAEVQDDDATQLKSGGSGSATILWKESGTGENKWAVVRLGDSQPVIRKAEMIDTLRQGDIGKFQGTEPGCGLDVDGDCGLKIKNTDLVGPGLMPVGDCQLGVQIVAGCGIEVTDDAEISVKAEDLAKSGLKTEGECGLAVNSGCGIWINDGKVQIAHDELAGDGLVIGDNCEIDVDCNWIKNECVKLGCGIWWNGDLLEVAHDELAGDGLVVVIGFDQISSQTLESTANLCDCECLSDSIPSQPMAMLTITEGEWNDMLANGGEVAWQTA